VIEDDLDGFGGAYSPRSQENGGEFSYDRNASPQRRRFTIGHEFGQLFAPRKKFPDGIRCDEAAVTDVSVWRSSEKRTRFPRLCLCHLMISGSASRLRMFRISMT